jgi:hypothetical protein
MQPSVHPDQPEPEAFRKTVEPLEFAADRALDGIGREKALAAWLECPRGFEIVARRAQTQAKSNAIGLMLWMVDRRHHEAAERQLARASDEELALEGVEDFTL